MTLCLPTSIIDSLFAVSKTSRSPPSHVLIRVSSSSSSSSTCCSSSSCQLVCRDFTSPSLKRSFLKSTIELPSFTNNSNNASESSPVSSSLGPSLTQSFIDLPFVILAVMTKNEDDMNYHFLDQCKVVKATDYDESINTDSTLLFSQIRIAVPLPIVTSPASPPLISTLTVSCDVKNRVDEGKLLLNEKGLLNSLIICSGGQGSRILQTDDRGNESFFDVMQLEGKESSSMGIVTSDTRVVVNQKPSFKKERKAVINDSRQKEEQREKKSEDDLSSYFDYHSKLNEATRILLNVQKEEKPLKGLLITSPPGNGKSRFAKELIQSLTNKSTTNNSCVVHHMMRSRSTVFDILETLKNNNISSSSACYLVFDTADQIFSPSVSGSENLDLDDQDAISKQYPSVVSQLHSVLSSSNNNNSINNIILICIMTGKAASVLIPDNLNRTLFTGSTIHLDLPNERQRGELLTFFGASKDDSTILQLAQSSIGFSIWDIKIVSQKIINNQQNAAESDCSPSLPRALSIIKTHVPLSSLHSSSSSSSSNNNNNKQKLTLDSSSKITWDDIAGLKNIKEAIHRSIIWPINNPRKARLFGIDKLSGIMLHGPPGCAKTTIARAICSEGKFGAFFHLDCASVLSAYVGEAERTIRDVFHQARVQAPSVIFFDEIESFGVKRKAGGGGGGGSSDVTVRLLATLLTEMDGVNSSFALNSNNKISEDDLDDASHFGVCVIGATNLLHMVDDALLRPGRFDLLLEVPLPYADDRTSLFEHCLKKSNRNISSSSNSSTSTSSSRIVADTQFLSAVSRGCSGAEITGSWRDGVVETLMKMNRDLLLNSNSDDTIDDVEQSKEIDVTQAVVEAIRNIKK